MHISGGQSFSLECTTDAMGRVDQRTFPDLRRRSSQTRLVLVVHLQLIFIETTSMSEVLLLGTGKSVVQLPLALRNHLSQVGIQVDVMDTVRF